MSGQYEVENVVGISETNKALLVEVADLEDEPVWVPRSQISEDSEVYKTGDEGTLVVSAWFAEKKGWL